MNATTNQLSIAVAAALPAQTVKLSKSAVMKAAHAIQKAAAKAWNCSVREILFNVCLEMARAKETFCNKEKTMNGEKLKGYVFRKEMLKIFPEENHQISIRETSTFRDGKRKVFLSIEIFNGKKPKTLMGQMLHNGNYADIHEMYISEVKVSDERGTNYSFNAEQIKMIISAMKGHQCKCSDTISMADGIDFNSQFIEMLK
jgi:hypothetical protein